MTTGLFKRVLRSSSMTAVTGALLLALSAVLLIPAPSVSAAGHSERFTGVPARQRITGTPPGDQSPLHLDQNLPFTAAVRRGRLENGMDYFVRSHGRPENTVVLRLIVDTGSVLELDDEQGLAHFVEHMAFNGTEDFAEGELVAYLESLGMRFGPDINAYTSFDETVYKLEIPADDEVALNRGFRVMQQWASALTFDPDALESERGVIVEEWRRGRGARARMMDVHIPVLLQDSRYADRLPIGDMDIVRTAPRETFVRFFDRWYRPDNMALVAVGDLPAERLESLIRTHLGAIPVPSQPLHRPYFFLPDQDGTRVSIAGDPEAQQSTIALYLPHRPAPMQQVRDYRSILVRSLFASIINERIRDLTRDPDSPIAGGGIGWSRFLRDTEMTVASAVVRDQQIPEALEVLVTELERAERYGVLETELDRARARFMQSIEEALVNAETRPGGRLADELVRHWTQGEPVPGIEFEYRMYDELLPAITVDEVNSIAARFTRPENRIILASLREDDQGNLPDGAPRPTEDQLLEILDRTENRTIAPPVPEDQHSLLLTEEPEPGTILERVEHPDVQTTELRLSNGMRVFVRPSDLKEDEILFSAYSPGGLSLVAEELVPAARLTSSVTGESGMAGLDASALERALAGRSVNLSTALGEFAERMSGQSRNADLEQLFQLIHLAFREPRFEQRALDTVRRRQIEQIRGAEASPQGRFGRRFQELYAAGDPRLRPLSEEDLQAVTLAQIEEVYRDRFADPRDFALFFVGTLSVDEVARLAETYLAGLTSPTLEHDVDDATFRFVESPRDNQYRHSEELLSETVRAGAEPVAQVGILYHSEYNWSREENHRFNSLGDLLSIRLREVIREDAGGTYGIGAGGWRRRRPTPRAFMQIFFGMDPERTEELVERALEVVEEIRRESVDREYVERIQAQQREQYRRNLQDNGYWLSVLEFAVQHGRDLDDIPRFPALIESLTAEQIRETAERYLDDDRRIEVRLQPLF